MKAVMIGRRSCEMVEEGIGSSAHVVGLQDMMTCRIFCAAMLENCRRTEILSL